MTKLITVTGRPGAGKTTVAAILAEKLADKYIVCLIDNNRNNINIYSSASPVDNINLYSCLSDKESCHLAIKESATKLNKNLYFFSGGHEPLTEEEIQVLKEQDIFEYIILDSVIEIKNEVIDHNITVLNPNNFEYRVASDSKNIIIVNRYADNTEFKIRKQDFKLFFCPEIINFTNGYELHLPESSETEIKKILGKIADKSDVNTKPKFKLFGGR